MTINNYREARALLLGVYAQRAKTGNQEFFAGAEERIADIPRIVDAELQAIARATEIEACMPSKAFADRVNEILERE